VTSLLSIVLQCQPTLASKTRRDDHSDLLYILVIGLFNTWDLYEVHTSSNGHVYLVHLQHLGFIACAFMSEEMT